MLNILLGHQITLKCCNCIRLVVRNDHIKGFFAPLKPKRDTAHYFNIVSISIFITFGIYRYTDNVKSKYLKCCNSNMDERCEKSLYVVVPYHRSDEFTRLTGHLMTQRDDSFLAS